MYVKYSKYILLRTKYIVIVFYRSFINTILLPTGYIMKTLGDKIRYFRNLKGWSQEEMSDKLKLSLPAYSKIERNITDVGFKRLNQIAKTLGITVVELLSDSSKPSEQADLKKALADRDKEINKLQKKIIELLENKK